MMYLKYLRYLIRHKWFVFLACRKLGVPWLGVLHDLSKLHPDEFVAYTRYFYGRPPGGSPERDAIRIQLQDDFDRAWHRHIHRNKHHPQHWLLRNDQDGDTYLEMPRRYVQEMVADWIGAGIAIKGHGLTEAPAELEAWWAENQHRHGYQMHPRTKALVDSLVASLVDEAEEDAGR